MEPTATSLAFLVAAVLLAAAAIVTRLTSRFGVPSLLLFLVLGLAARIGLPDVPAPDANTSFRLGAASLVLILFDGGLRTPLRAARAVLWPSIALASVGVAITAGVTAGIGRLLGFAWLPALLIGAVVSSTDAAAVFLALKAGHARLRERVGLLLELESGLNDPAAVFLTVTVTAAFATGFPPWPHLVLELAQELGIGLAGGFLGARVGRALLTRAQLPAAGLYPVLSVATAFGVYGLTSIAHGSGFLAVYVAALQLGRGNLPYRAGLLRVHDALAWLAQLTMFLALGLAVHPPDLLRFAVPGAILALGLALVARPLAVLVTLLPFRFQRPELAFIASTGLRGATPIILATYPQLSGTHGLEGLFPLVFVVVLVGAVVPGATVGWLARVFGLRQQAIPPAPAGLELVSHANYDGEFVSFYIDRASAVAGAKVRDLPLGDGMLLTMIVRGHEVLAPRGETQIEIGDHVYVFTKAADRGLAALLFGASEDE